MYDINIYILVHDKQWSRTVQVFCTRTCTSICTDQDNWTANDLCTSHVPFCKGAILEYVQYEQFTKKTAKLQHRRKGIKKKPFNHNIAKSKRNNKQATTPRGRKRKNLKKTVQFRKHSNPKQTQIRESSALLFPIWI